MVHIRFSILLLGGLFISLATAIVHPSAISAVQTPVSISSDTVYYVSSSGGSDTNNGLSPETAFKTIAQVNALNLQPGDQVLFKCGDTWRGEMLRITKSGTAGNPILYSSYPANCTNKPIISGSQPITGWQPSSGRIYVADLTAGANAGKFPHGINQLFRSDARLPLGRWPNIAGSSDGGYSTIDAAPGANQIVDNELPNQNWSGARVHIKGMRWYILNREVASSSATRLTLNSDAGCWGGTCQGWGYFINNHLQTLDQDGEWYYDAAASKVYLYSDQAISASIEGAVVLTDDDRSWGGIVLGKDLDTAISYVTVENFEVKNWYRHGIASPTNLKNRENSQLILRNNTIRNVDSIGLSLATWVFDAQDGQDGWRGGNNLQIVGNVIDGANHKGIDTYSKASLFADNIVRNIGLIENLGASGMGCGLTAGEGACTEDGDGIRIKVSTAADSGNTNTLRYNRLERIAYNGIDIFGYGNVLEYNVIQEACYAKGDCGAVRTFGGPDLNGTSVHDITLHNNIILDIPGNTDGTIERYRPLFGMGFYIDHYSRDVTIAGNTIISATVDGILYQNSTGTIQTNTLYGNNAGSMFRGQVGLYSDPTIIASFSGNILYSIKPQARTLIADNKDKLQAANNNYYFQPYLEKQIWAEGEKTFAAWQSYSGKDASSKTSWFTQDAGEQPLSTIFYNDSKEPRTVELGNIAYVDLDRNAVTGNITLQPFTSRVLIRTGEAPPQPTLTISSNGSGGPGSAFLVTGHNIPPSNNPLVVLLNGETMTSTLPITPTATGDITFLLVTAATTPPGQYIVTVMSNPQVTVSFTLVAGGPQHTPPTGYTGAEIVLPADLPELETLYLPVMRK